MEKVNIKKYAAENNPAALAIMNMMTDKTTSQPSEKHITSTIQYVNSSTNLTASRSEDNKIITFISEKDADFTFSIRVGDKLHAMESGLGQSVINASEMMRNQFSLNFSIQSFAKNAASFRLENKQEKSLQTIINFSENLVTIKNDLEHTAALNESLVEKRRVLKELSRELHGKTTKQKKAYKNSIQNAEKAEQEGVIAVTRHTKKKHHNIATLFQTIAGENLESMTDPQAKDMESVMRRAGCDNLNPIEREGLSGLSTLANSFVENKARQEEDDLDIEDIFGEIEAESYTPTTVKKGGKRYQSFKERA